MRRSEEPLACLHVHSAACEIRSKLAAPLSRAIFIGFHLFSEYFAHFGIWELEKPIKASKTVIKQLIFLSHLIPIVGTICQRISSFSLCLYNRPVSLLLLPPSPRGQRLCNLRRVRRVAANTVVSHSEKSRDWRRHQSEFAFPVGSRYALTSCQIPSLGWLLDLAARLRFPGQLV